MSEQSNILAEMAQRHAELIMKSAGSSLRHYMKATHAKILLATLGAIEEAYRAGAAYGVAETRKRLGGEARATNTNVLGGGE